MIGSTLVEDEIKKLNGLKISIDEYSFICGRLLPNRNKSAGACFYCKFENAEDLIIFNLNDTNIIEKPKSVIKSDIITIFCTKIKFDLVKNTDNLIVSIFNVTGYTVDIKRIKDEIEE